MNTWWRHWSREHWNVATVYTVLTSTPTPAAALQNFLTTPAPANCSVCWLQQGGSDGLCSRLLLRLSELQSGRHGISSSRVTSTEYRVQSAELHTILCRVGSCSTSVWLRGRLCRGPAGALQCCSNTSHSQLQ